MKTENATQAGYQDFPAPEPKVLTERDETHNHSNVSFIPAGGVNPWKIHHVSLSSRPGLWLHGTNLYIFPGDRGRTFSWGIDSEPDPEFASLRYDYRGATITDDARVIFLKFIATWTTEQISAVPGLAKMLFLHTVGRR